MENQICFDLTTALENWRQELAAQAGLTAENRRELETHLRDAIAGFQQRGLNDEEAFWLARRRTGQPQALGEEFVKADPSAVWRERLFWVGLTVFFHYILNCLQAAMANALPVLSYHEKYFAAKMTLLLSPFYFPMVVFIVAAVLIRSGKMVRQFSKLTPLFENRLRLAIIAFIIISLATMLDVASYHFPSSRSHGGSIWPLLYLHSLNPLIIATGLVWLLPPQKRKATKRA